MKARPEHLAEFITKYCKGPHYARYREDCIKHWRKVYGDNFVDKVEKLIEGAKK